jgi:hypothetical protein
MVQSCKVLEDDQCEKTVDIEESNFVFLPGGLRDRIRGKYEGNIQEGAYLEFEKRRMTEH